MAMLGRVKQQSDREAEGWGNNVRLKIKAKKKQSITKKHTQNNIMDSI